MAKIDVYTSEMSSLSARLKKISSVIGNAEQVAGKVQGNLDFQIAAKADISGALSRTRRQLRQQKDKVIQMAKLTTTASSEFRTADGQMDKSARSILGKITAPIAGAVLGVKDLFRMMPIKRYQSINSIFMPAGTVITVAGLGELIRRLQQIINKWRQSTGGTVSGGGSGAGVSTAPVDVPKPEIVNTGNGNIKPYQGNYSNYNVVNCFDPKYLLNQGSYNIYNSKGKNCGCMACGVAMMQYMKTGRYLNPEDPKVWDDKTKNTQWNYIEKVPNSSKRSVDDQLKILYNNLNEGTPVMIALSKSNNLNSNHNVVVVGIRQGADINNLQKSDFLVADPNGGVVRTLAEAEEKSGKIMPDGSNWTMWKANNKY